MLLIVIAKFFASILPKVSVSHGGESRRSRVKSRMAGGMGVGRGSGWVSGVGRGVGVGGGWRAERAVPRRGTIMVSPTQAVPEVPVVWGYDDIRGIVCRRYTIMVAKIPPKITQKTNATKITSKKRDGNDPTIIAYLRHAARSARCTPSSNPLSRSLHPQLLKPYDPPLGFIWFTITASFLRCGVGVFSSFSKVNIQFLRMFCVSVPVLLV